MDLTPATQFTPGVASDGEKVFVSWIGAPTTVNGVNALDLETGSEMWEWTFAGNDAETISAPTYSNGGIYVHRWGHSSSCGVDCHDVPRLFGIDAINGAQLFDQSHPGQWSSGGVPAASGGEVFVAGGYNGGLDNYDGTTGTIKWSADMPQRYGWIPAVDESYVYTGFNGNLTIVDRTTGDQQTVNALTPNAAGVVATPVAISQQEVYVASGRLVTRFNPSDENAAWDYVASSGNIQQGMAVGENALIVNLGDRIVALNRTTGNELWNWPAPSALVSNVLLMDDHLYVATDTETLAINTNNRKVEWSAPYSGQLASVNNHLLISNPAALYAFTQTVPEPATAWLLLPLLMLIRGNRFHS